MKKKARHISVSLTALSILSITVAAVAATSVCIAIFSSVYNRTVIQNAAVRSEQTVQQAARAVDNYLDTMKNKLNFINETVQSCDGPDDFIDSISVTARIQSDIYSVTVYDADGGIVSCTNGKTPVKEKILKDLSFDKALFESAQDFALSTPHVNTLFQGEYPWVVTLAVKSGENILGEGVYIAIDFEFSEIAKYIGNVGLGSHGYCYITDNDYNIIYHPQQQVLFSGLKTENTDYIRNAESGVIYNDNAICTVSSVSDGLWKLVGVSFIDEIAAERRTQIAMSLAVSFLCCALIALAVLLIYSRIVTKPVHTLRSAMKAFETHADDFSYTGGGEAVSELQDLSLSFEHMAQTIKELMKRVRSEETALRKTELKALQAQINPHFLYNTLDSIQWMCEQGKNAEATEMIGALARLFRISISRGRELITIKEELMHAESYLIIQSFRYSSQFSYSIKSAPELEGYLCNKITVQPLIENAIYHGIDRMVDEGRIEIEVKEAPDDPGDILITVSDNGVGMTEEQCRKILRKERSDSSGIGIKNVNDRLKIYFGEKYGLKIESELDVGTTVTVRLPKIDREAENEY